MDYDYDELLNILGKIHSEPAFSHIKEYVRNNQNKFSPEQYKILERLISQKEKFFNPSPCNRAKEIRLYYKDRNGHEFTIAYSGGKAYELCNEARESGMTLPEYIKFMTAGSKDFIGWTMNESNYTVNETHESNVPNVSIRRATYNERYNEPEEPVNYAGRVIRRNIKEAEKSMEVQVNMADLFNRLRLDMEELIQESSRENIAQIEKLRQEINALEARIEASKGIEEPEKKERIITRVLDSIQYRHFLANAYKLGLPVRYAQIARGQYQVSIAVSNEGEENRALTFLGEAEKYERETSPMRKTHLQGYNDVLNALCRTYTKESGMPCGLSRTGALSTLADKLLEYADSQGIDWQALYDIESMDLFAKKGQIYTREQADEAFNNAISQITGRNMAKHLEEEVEGDECTDDAIMSYILDYDASAVFKHEHPDKIREDVEEMHNNAINGLKICGYYPNRLDEARKIASVEFEHYGTSYDDQISAMVERLEQRGKS